ncbi:MAG TPA: hypothetical protein VEG39_05780 [Clostridia bacterium]|nr:hypothetical protein [Clostridia bacterium]
MAAKRVGIKAAAEATGLSEWELRQGARSGRYPHFRVGDPEHGRIIFDIDLLEEHLRNVALNNIKQPDNIKTYGVIRRVGD